MSDSNQTQQKSKTPGRFAAYLDRLSTSSLLFVVGAAFIVDLFFFDPLPFVDEVILGVLTLLLARWRSNAQKRARSGSNGGDGGQEKPPPKNVTPD